MKSDLIIMGSGIAGNLAAMYFRKKFPDINVTLVGKQKSRSPLVGESTVEVTVQFLNAIGLSTLLEEKHYHKYGLSYYFKQSYDKKCNKYVVHEAPGINRLPSFNLNRNVFDQDIRDINATLGIRRIDQDVQEVILSDNNDHKHQVVLKGQNGETTHIDADWVIDASGRRRLLAKQLQLHKAPAYQRSSFWFRMNSFDRTKLFEMTDTRVNHHCYDPYYVTHHFYGQGYWIWIIPLKASTGKDHVSIGITYRPELLGQKNVQLESLLTILDNDHPSISAMIRSGSIDDTCSYNNYMYEAEQYYSKSGWYLLGDAAFTFDPANSAGLAYVAHEITQIASMISKDRNHELTQDYVDAMERHVKAQLALQDSWSNWYLIMNDPLKMAWTLKVANMGYFHVVLPNFINGSYLDGRSANHFAKLLPRFSKENAPKCYPFPELLELITEQIDPSQPLDPELIPNLYEKTINFRLYRATNDKDRARFISRYFFKLARLRLYVMKKVKWQFNIKHGVVMTKSLIAIASDLIKSTVIFCIPSFYVKKAKVNSSLSSPYTNMGDHLRCLTHDKKHTPPLQSMMKNDDQPAQVDSREISEMEM
ncbi:NAD(P)/FAD-dependent oxidoreductase [Pseudoalteromonas maricaloris]